MGNAYDHLYHIESFGIEISTSPNRIIVPINIANKNVVVLVVFEMDAINNPNVANIKTFKTIKIIIFISPPEKLLPKCLNT
nr:hypothetical protein [Marinitoga lauensis]